MPGRLRVDVAAGARRLGLCLSGIRAVSAPDRAPERRFRSRKRFRNPRRDAGAPAVDHWLSTFELTPLGHRFPDELSGDQRQRTALARALVAEPRALLLDEPFAALDSGLRERLRAELGELQLRLAVPIVLITHDAADVAAFAGEVIALDGGRVVGNGAAVSAPA